jgi:hypothetical protein
MRKIKLLSIYLLFLLMFISLTGCGGGNGGSKSSGNVTLQFWGFPSDYPANKIMILVTNDSSILAQYSYDCNASQLFQQTINVPSNALYINVYLFCTGYDSVDPVYCTGFNIGKQTYSNCFWLDYNELANYNTYRFGVCKSFAENIVTDFSKSLNFNDTPYFLYKLTGTQNITAAISASQGMIKEEEDSTDGNLGQSIIYSSAISNLSKFIAINSNTYYILLEPADYTASIMPTATLKVTGLKTVSFPDHIIQMIPGNNPNIIYGITDNSKIYYINPITQSANSYSLPVQPTSVSYSSQDNLLYISSLYSSSIYIWNPDTKNYTSINCNAGSYGIAVDPANNRIYNLISNGSSVGLCIINKSAQTVISTTNLDGYSILLDSINRMVYTPNSQYSVTDDKVTKKQTTDGKILAVSPDGTKVIVGKGNQLNFIKSSDFSQVYGTYSLSYGPSLATFSPDGTLLYEVNGSAYDTDNNIYIFGTTNYNLIRTVPFRGLSSGNPLFITNSDGSILVCNCYCYNDYGYQNSYLYFYPNLANTYLSQLKNLKTMTVKQILSELPTKNILQFKKVSAK